MRSLMKARTVAVGTVVATAGVLALTGPALAQPHITAVKTVKVPAEVATSISLPACPAGTTASFGGSVPALPDGPQGAVFPVASKNVLKLAGAWPVPGAAAFAVTVHCSGGTTTSANVKVAPSPPLNSAAGVGSDTMGPLFDQFSGDYNATVTATAAHLYSFDAVNPDSGAVGDLITPKTGCAAIARPDGSSPGILALASSQMLAGTNCVSFARSSQLPSPNGALTVVRLAGDAVTWSHQATTNAPVSLTAAQLNEIYSCTVPAVGGHPANDWADLGGKPGAIAPFLPQAGSGTTSFWLAAIGVAAPGPCVSSVGDTLQQNEGVNPALNTPDAIFPYSIGNWVAQAFHSAACTNHGCTGTPPCVPTRGKNAFGCDVRGTMVLGRINGIPPTTGTGAATSINLAFPAVFDRFLYDVVPFDPNTADHIPGPEAGAPGGVDLEPILSSTGWACASKTARADIKNYGFLVLPMSICGT